MKKLIFAVCAIMATAGLSATSYKPLTQDDIEDHIREFGYQYLFENTWERVIWDITGNDIKKGMAETNRMDQIYETRLKDNPKLRCRLSFWVATDSTGRVSCVSLISSDTNDSVFVEQVREEILHTKSLEGPAGASDYFRVELEFPEPNLYIDHIEY